MTRRHTTPWQAQRGHNECGCTCAGGNPCECANHTHTQHICRHAHCICHQPESYGVVRVGKAYQPIAAVTWGAVTP